jgi:flagellar basal body P-ring protein FlgI
MIRHYLFWLGLLGSLTVSSACSWLGNGIMRSQSPEDKDEKKPTGRLVGDIAVPFGLYPVRVESIGLVTGLRGTGSDPAPSNRREALMEEMKIRGVENPNAVLASKNCSLVLVRGTMRPGIQKGDPFDIEVCVPPGSETTSLRGGYLLETRLGELGAMDDGMFHQGRIYGRAEGPVLVDPSVDPKKDRVMACRGRILGGGVALQSRPLAMVLSRKNQTVVNSSRVADAVNHRFHTYRNGLQIGMAKALNNEMIELQVHPRYKDNILRYVEVVRSLALVESSQQRMQRLTSLKKMLRKPETAPKASLQLEAIGSEGIPVLLAAVGSQDPEVRLYTAEALAYLDRTEAAQPLGELAFREPAFRIYALTALSAMQDYAAAEQLRGMLSSSSAETRYGAFRALTAMSIQDPLTADGNIGKDFSYYALDVEGPPMIHVTRSRKAEIAIFGKDQKFLTPLAVNAGNQIMITSHGSEEISVGRFAAGEADQKRVVSTKVDDVVRAVVELGGTYPDVVQALQEAKASGGLSGRFEVDALPEAGRTYQRTAGGGDDITLTGSAEIKLSQPAPELFEKGKQQSPQSEGGNKDAKADEDGKSEKKASKKAKRKGLFG